MLILAIAVWTAGSLGRSGEHRRASPAIRQAITLLTTLVVITIMSGGFVAGLDAGRIFNEFPLMGGRVVPEGYDAGLGLRNFFENPVAAQFNHRLLAVLLALLTFATGLVAERRWPAHVSRWMRFAALMALVQLTLGITTLLSGAAVGVAMGHQLGAVGLLTVLLLAGVEAKDARA